MALDISKQMTLACQDTLCRKLDRRWWAMCVYGCVGVIHVALIVSISRALAMIASHVDGGLLH